MLRRQKHILSWGWGFAQIWRTFFCFLLAFIFQGEEIITPIFGTVFCADFGALIYEQIFARIFCADFVCRFLRRFFVCNVQILAQILAQIFAQTFLRRSGASEIGVPESRKNARKICGKTRACPERGPYSSSAALSRRHVTQ